MNTSTRLVLAIGPAVLATAVFAPAATAAIAYNPVVLQVGDGVNFSSQRGQTSTLVEYQAGVANTIVSSAAFNNDTTLGPALVNTTSQRREAYLSNNPALLANALAGVPSTSGYVYAPGYNASANTASVFTSANAARSFGYAPVTSAGIGAPTVALTIPAASIYGNNTIESVTGNDTATAFYSTGNGSNSGTRYVDAAPTNAAVGPNGDRRTAEIYNGYLWSTTTFSLLVYNTVTLPTSSTTETTVLASVGAATEFLVFNDPTLEVDTTNSFGVDTIYAADENGIVSGGGIKKFTWNGSTWALAYTLTGENLSLTVGARGLAGAWDPDLQKMVLFTTDAVAGSTIGNLYQVTDNGPGPVSAYTVLGTSPTGTVFRGIALAPAVPEPATLAILALTGTLLFRRPKH